MNFPSQKPAGLLPRIAAWEILQAVAAGEFSEVALERILKKYSMKGIDRRLVMELSYGAIRQRKLLDCWIDYLAKVSHSKQPPLLRWLLHLGLYQILKMDRMSEAAAINTTVEVAKKSKLSRLAPVVNGVLRSALRCKQSGIELPLPNDCIERISQTESLPIWLVEKLIDWRGQNEAEKLAKSFNRVPNLDIRVNILKISVDNLRHQFDLAGISSSLINDCPSGLQIISSSSNLKSWPGYKEGFWSVQDRSSQWVSPLLDPTEGDRILDVCSAPGGKATHLAELIKDKGEIWAIDRSKRRIKRVIANSSRLKLESIHCLEADSTSLLEVRPNWKGSFQRILVDAPCSGLGTLSRNPDARWRINPSKIDELIALQLKLLKAILPLLDSGGRIVYSTCTIHPEENYFQIQNLLRLYPELDLIYQRQIWPSYDNFGDGFYAAVIESK